MKSAQDSFGVLCARLVCCRDLLLFVCVPNLCQILGMRRGTAACAVEVVMKAVSLLR